MITIVKGSHEAASRYFKIAEKEGVSTATPEGAIWFMAYDATGVESMPELGVLVGFACISFIGKQARFKSDWVLPSYRGKGIHTKLMDARLDEVLKLKSSSMQHLEKITAFCNTNSVHNYCDKYGFMAGSKNAAGAVFVEKPLD